MRYKPYMAIFILFVFILMPFLTCFALADNQATVNIHMIHQNPRQALGSPVMVTQIWHYINVTLESNDFQKLTIEFYRGNAKPNTGDMDSTNYYEWEYNANTQQWADALEYGGYNYLNSELCDKNGETYSFCVGVSDSVISYSHYYVKNKFTWYYENFTLIIYEDNIEVYSGYVLVEQSKRGLSKSHADKIIFEVEPFTEMEALGNDYFRIGNSGNIPLIFDIDYGKYEDLIDVPNLGVMVPPFETIVFDGIKLYSESWKPGVISITGPVIKATIPEGYVLTTAPLSLNPVPEINSPNIEIRVGRATYELKEEIFEDTDLSFQYPTSLTMTEGEEKEITVYISGNGAITLNFGTENIKIKKIIYQNTETSTPINVNSKNTSEYPVKIRIQALSQDIDAKLIYYISYDGKLYYVKDTELPSTSITIGPPESNSSSSGGISALQIIAVVAIIALVIFYMSNTRRKHRWR